MNLINSEGGVDYMAVTAALEDATASQADQVESELAAHLGEDEAARIVGGVAAEIVHSHRIEAAASTLADAVDAALAHVGAAAHALFELRSGEAWHVEYDCAAGDDMSDQLQAAGRALRAAKALNPGSPEMEARRALLAEAADHVTACAVPELVEERRVCAHGEVFPCKQTKLAWRLRGIDPAKEHARVVAEAMLGAASDDQGGR